MGTNFYLLDNEDDEKDGNRNSDEQHIGKRCGMGSWCIKCNVSLCKGPIEEIHDGENGFHDNCPKCGIPSKETTGVCSFTWNSRSAMTRKALEESLDEICARDEYGDRYTGKQMLKIIADCKMQIKAKEWSFS